eukprot:CAMPEP_0203688536 /NCGR_PEP_ID=MMETSP0091-20130426/1211_1 /ASSEMBLY_ACC=CAM_ASM_001089 /TAXON_ID=426623 /ORGANISM="Chaetoceros affinis, Strain CCMP159" /LENGTH=214 /DNA_ID=CAMNT_0050558063 /DNA_START=40 /DNA_END=684 /DNA_ORIENTATION=+
MKVSSFILLLATAIMSVSSVTAEGAKVRRKEFMSPSELENKRKLSHKSGKGSKKEEDPPMEAAIAPLGDDYEDLGGWVSIEYKDDDMIIDYSIKDGPKRCDKCKLVLYDGKSCDDLGDPFFDTEDGENPFTVGKGSAYITNKKGRAAGHYKIDNGYKYKKNKCKFVVLFDKKDDDRRLSRRSGDGKRQLGKGSKKDSKPKEIGCGQLVPEDGEC